MPLAALPHPCRDRGLEEEATARPTQERPHCQVSGVCLSACTTGLRPPGPGHSHRHSLAASAVPRTHGRSWKKGRQRSQSVPVVLCWHRQASWPASSGPHSLACPLHLHLRKE